MSKRTSHILASGSITHTLQIGANLARPIAMNCARLKDFVIVTNEGFKERELLIKDFNIKLQFI